MHSRPKIPVISSRKMQRRHRHEFDRLPSPDPRLSLRFMPGRSRRIQRRGICVEILSPIGTTIPGIQQPPRTHRGHYHNVGRHSSRTFETWRLCPFDDRQHNLGRLATKVKFHRRRRGPHPSNNSTRCCPPSRNTLPLKRNKRIQSVVPRSR